MTTQHSTAQLSELEQEQSPVWKKKHVKVVEDALLLRGVSLSTRIPQSPRVVFVHHNSDMKRFRLTECWCVCVCVCRLLTTYLTHKVFFVYKMIPLMLKLCVICNIWYLFTLLF